MLLPALGRARDASKKIVCASNLKQIGAAMLNYADDNNGWGTLVNYYSSRFLLGPIYNPRDEHTLVPYLGGNVVSGGASVLKAYDLLPVGVCPSGRRDGSGITAPHDDDYPNGSYSFSAYLASYDYSVDERFGKIYDVKRPSKRIFCTDVSGEGTSSRPLALYKSDQFAKRHSGGNNFIFVDNHTEYWMYEACMATGTGSNSQPDGVWHDKVW
jgi:prepilin-type processing-associated H-X9-DG protein